MKSFANCNFTVGKVKILNIAGVDVSGFNNISDLSINDYATLMQQAFSKEIDSKLEIEIQAYNQQENKASISGLDWELYLMDELYSSGVVTDPVEILPGQKASFNVVTNINLYRIVHSKSLLELLSIIIKNNGNIDLSNMDMIIKVKPWYRMGSSIKKYPGFIKIKP